MYVRCAVARASQQHTHPSLARILVACTSQPRAHPNRTRIPVVRSQAGSCARQGVLPCPTLPTLSRHGPRISYVATEARKWAVSHLGYPALAAFFSFSFLALLIPYTIAFLLQGQHETWKTCQNLFIVQMNLVATMLFLHVQKLGFLPKIHKIHYKAKSDPFFFNN